MLNNDLSGGDIWEQVSRALKLAYMQLAELKDDIGDDQIAISNKTADELEALGRELSTAVSNARVANGMCSTNR